MLRLNRVRCDVTMLIMTLTISSCSQQHIEILQNYFCFCKCFSNYRLSIFGVNPPWYVPGTGIIWSPL